MIVLLVFGGDALHAFSATLLIGFTLGTYSSVYIASPLTIWLDERTAAREKAARSGGSKGAGSNKPQGGGKDKDKPKPKAAASAS